MQIKMSRHCAEKVAAAGISAADLSEAFNNPDTTYPSNRYPTQDKRIGNGLCLCVDRNTGIIVTVFQHKVETNLRADQRDRDALAWNKRRAQLQPTH